MTSNERRKYLRALSSVSPSWVVASLSVPSVHMQPVHLTLHRVALRRAYRAGYRDPQVNRIVREGSAS